MPFVDLWAVEMCAESVARGWKQWHCVTTWVNRRFRNPVFQSDIEMNQACFELFADQFEMEIV